MFIKLPKQNGLLNVDDDFASLTAVDASGNMTFKFSYSVNQSDIIKRQFFRVRVTTFAKNVKKLTILDNRKGEKASPLELVQNVQRQVPDYKTAISTNKSYEISNTTSDITAKINNSIIAPIRNGAQASSLHILNKTKLTPRSVQDMNLSNEVVPILQRAIQSSLNVIPAQSAQNAIRSLIVQQGIDPSSITANLKNRVSALDISRGQSVPVTRQTPDSKGVSKARQAYDQILGVPVDPASLSIQLPDEQVVQVLVTVPDERIDVPVTVILRRDKVVSDKDTLRTVFVKFDLINKCDVSVGTITKQLDVQKHLTIFKTPKLPPIVKFARYETLTIGNLLIAQRDPMARSARVYQKQLSHVQNVTDDYQLIGEYPIVATAGLVTVPVNMSGRNTNIFRVVSVGEDDVSGFEFTNIVVNPSSDRTKKLRFASLVTKITDVGVSIEVSELPGDVVAFYVMRKNVTIFEPTYSIIGGDAIQVDRTAVNKMHNVVDSTVIDGHTYEYVCRLLYADGTKADVSEALVEFKPLVTNLVNTQITNTNVVTDATDLDVQFTISSTIAQTNIDAINSMLTQQNILQYFSPDVLKQRDELQKLIAWQVYRINLTTGDRENFGVITSGSFSDATLRSVGAVKPLHPGQKYRYEVSTLFRAPETMFDKLQKQVTDPRSKKTYTFSPAKFLHPLALGRGNIAERSAISSHYPKSDMSFGNVGDLTTLDVSFVGDTSVVANARVERFDLGQNLIQWQLVGSTTNVDHFLVSLRDNGTKTPIGKTHANDEKSGFEFIHRLRPDDVGSFDYVITPVLNDYTIGADVATNRITV